VTNLEHKLLEEFIVVALVCALFLFHLRSALVAIVSLPLGILAAYTVMYYQGVNANIMSLGGIAIAIGAMVDAAVVMIENAHKHIEPGATPIPARSSKATRTGGDRRRGGRSRPGAVLFAADHRAVLHSGVHAGSPGRPPVRAAGLHQDLRDGGGGRPGGDADSGADGLPDPRRIPDETPTRSTRADPLPTGRCSSGAAPPEGDACSRGGDRRRTVWPVSGWAANSCRRWTRATCCTCRRRCPGSAPARRPSCCSRPTA
jgi:hypothetical protein